MHGETIKKM